MSRAFPASTTLACTAALLASQPLSAQEYEAETGSRIAKPAPARLPMGRSMPGLETHELFAKVARCVVRRSPKLVSAYLKEKPFSDAAKSLTKKIVDADCLYGGNLSFKIDLFRGAVFDTLYGRDYFRRVPSLPAADVTIDYAAEVSGQISPEHVIYVFGRNFADCVYRAEPVATRAVLLSEAGSQAETRAFDAMMPAFGRCLEAGQTLKFSRSSLRGFLAEVAYRLAEHAAPTASNPSKALH